MPRRGLPGDDGDSVGESAPMAAANHEEAPGYRRGTFGGEQESADDVVDEGEIAQLLADAEDRDAVAGAGTANHLIEHAAVRRERTRAGPIHIREPEGDATDNAAHRCGR